MRENRGKTHKSTAPKPSLLHVVVPFMKLYNNNNSFHPLVLLENNLICIFMIILKKVSKGGEIVKQHTK